MGRRAEADMEPQPCRNCGAPVKWVRKAGGWVHTRPLAAFKLSRRERADILADPPHAGHELHRQTVIHPAQPE
jgi:hypothetical protein